MIGSLAKAAGRKLISTIGLIFTLNKKSKTITIGSDEIRPGKKLFLNLGRVEVIAAVKLNGKLVDLLWKEPFLLDITSVVQAGHNDLEIAVTTCLLIACRSSLVVIGRNPGLRDEAIIIFSNKKALYHFLIKGDISLRE